MTKVVTPSLTEHPKTVKDAIILSLSKEWPLTARKLYNKVRKYGFSVTYQAVHKVLKKMLEDGMLLKENKEYSINPEWLEKVKTFAGDVKDIYEGKLEASLVKVVEDGHGNFTFNTIYELDKFLLTLMEKMGPVNKDGIFCLEWDHYWTPLFLNKTIYKKIKEASKMGTFYLLVHSNSKIDKWCLDFWRRGSKSIKVKAGVKGKDTFLVAGDYVIQVFYPEKLMKELDKVYSSANSVQDLDIDKLFQNIFEKKTEIPVTINMNPVLARQIRERIVSYFK